MTDKPPSPAEYLAHYGTKGMKWGQRKKTILAARSNRGKLGDAVGDAEQVYLRARKSGNAKSTQTALKKLNDAHVAEEKNKLTAATLTRGEQAAVALLGPLGAIVLTSKAITTRNSKKIKPYPVKILKNVDPEK